MTKILRVYEINHYSSDDGNPDFGSNNKVEIYYVIKQLHKHKGIICYKIYYSHKLFEIKLHGKSHLQENYKYLYLYA